MPFPYLLPQTQKARSYPSSKISQWLLSAYSMKFRFLSMTCKPSMASSSLYKQTYAHLGQIWLPTVPLEWSSFMSLIAHFLTWYSLLNSYHSVVTFSVTCLLTHTPSTANSIRIDHCFLIEPAWISIFSICLDCLLFWLVAFISVFSTKWQIIF